MNERRLDQIRKNLPNGEVPPPTVEGQQMTLYDRRGRVVLVVELPGVDLAQLR